MKETDIICNECGRIIPDKFRDYLIELQMVVSKEDFEKLIEQAKDDRLKKQEMKINELSKNKLSLTKRISHLEEKLKEKYSEEFLTCQVCFRKLGNLTGLRNHISRKHRQSPIRGINDN